MKIITTKEKAIEICNKFNWTLCEDGYIILQTVEETKRCALIAVDEILTIGCIEVPYWLEVKQEIEKL
jgi:hypothetical protein